MNYAERPDRRQSGGPVGALFEDKFARVYADIHRLDQLRDGSQKAAQHLVEETVKRLDQRLDAQETAVSAALAAAEKAVVAALAASDKAVTKAEIAQAKVNETQNEFRGSLRDQAATQMPRAEAENVFRELRGLIATQSQLTQELRSRIDVGPPSLSVLQARSDVQTGRQLGVQLTQGMLFAALGATATIVSLIVVLANYLGRA